VGWKQKSDRESGMVGIKSRTGEGNKSQTDKVGRESGMVGK
jgi:hypothetical protein